ncbi:coiled-coil domain-containing protein 171 isoform X2 [Xenopus laevis]|nr:coiled-coil domain-containing protein 171 isoform X2 [Xenopus laevis]XP_041419461.1 coiled-coil domain-containing protein 171 isoform X2 [Xenopus laevis]
MDELIAKHNEELQAYETQIAMLRSQIEIGEPVQQNLRYELSGARKQYRGARMSEKELKANSVQIQIQFKAQVDELQQKMFSVENIFRAAQLHWQEKQKNFQKDLQNRDNIIQNCLKEQESLISETHNLKLQLQKEKANVQVVQQKLLELETECCNNPVALKHQRNEPDYSDQKEEKLQVELEEANRRIKSLEDNIEAERAAHLETKMNSEVIQLQIQDIERSLDVEKTGLVQTISDLDMIRNQLIEVEAAYNSEKKRAEEFAQKLKQTEHDFSILGNQLKSDLEQNYIEDSSVTVKQGLAMNKNEHYSLDEAHPDIMKELQSLVDNFTVLNSCTPEIDKERVKPAGFSVLLQTLKHILTDNKNRLEDLSSKQEAAECACTWKNEEIASLKAKKQTLFNNLKKTQSNLEAFKEELRDLHTKCTDQEYQIAVLQMDLENAQNGCQNEKLRVLECDAEIKKLSRAYQNDTEEKLTFLHSLYQRLVTGYVLTRNPQSLLGTFSWMELYTFLEENVDLLISDLNQANEKVSNLEGLCKTKSEVLKDLQKSHEESLKKLAEEMKAQEVYWLKQRRDLEEHYIKLLQKVQAKSWSIAEKSQDKMKNAKDQMTQENI